MITIVASHTFILENLKNYIIYFNKCTDNETLHIVFRNLGVFISLIVLKLETIKYDFSDIIKEKT